MNLKYGYGVDIRDKTILQRVLSHQRDRYRSRSGRFWLRSYHKWEARLDRNQFRRHSKFRLLGHRQKLLPNRIHLRPEFVVSLVRQVFLRYRLYFCSIKNVRVLGFQKTPSDTLDTSSWWVPTRKYIPSKRHERMQFDRMNYHQVILSISSMIYKMTFLILAMANSVSISEIVSRVCLASLFFRYQMKWVD